LEAGTDVILCNPGLVREGIDLLQFKAIIWYGMTDDAILVNQANARIYRIGQTHETYIYYLGYNKTYQSERWAITAKKVAAMSAMHGDVRSGLAALLGETSMITAVQDVMIEYEHRESDLTMEELPEIQKFAVGLASAPAIMKANIPVVSQDNWYEQMENWKKANKVEEKPKKRKAVEAPAEGVPIQVSLF
jgi:hypothetical protein